MCSCFCKKSKHGEEEARESETLSQDKASKENTEQRVLAAAVDPGVSSHGVSTANSNGGGTAALAVTAAHISAVEGGSSHGYGGGDGGGADSWSPVLPLHLHFYPLVCTDNQPLPQWLLLCAIKCRMLFTCKFAWIFKGWMVHFPSELCPIHSIVLYRSTRIQKIVSPHMLSEKQFQASRFRLATHMHTTWSI